MAAEDYTVLEEIGKGTFGTVSKIRRNSDGKTLVWKEMDYGKMNEKEKNQLVSEVNILRELRHPNVVRYYDRIIDRAQSKIFVVMEYCEGGDLQSFIKKCRRERRYIEEELVWKVFTQILQALEACHFRKEGVILHRDIKPGNVFLDGSQNVKLGDFGLARVLGSKSVFAHTYVGTPYYMSPEQVREQAYNEKSDIWSLGCLIFEMAALVPPFDAANQLALAVKIKAGKFARIPSTYSEGLNNAVRAMIQVEQSKRPGIRKLMKLPEVALRIRERQVEQSIAQFKAHEKEAQTRKDDIERREAETARREDACVARERRIEALYKEIARRAGTPMPSLEALIAEVEAAPESRPAPRPKTFDIIRAAPAPLGDVTNRLPVDKGF